MFIYNNMKNQRIWELPTRNIYLNKIFVEKREHKQDLEDIHEQEI